jgi:predicted nucleotidyltransferase
MKSLLTSRPVENPDPLQVFLQKISTWASAQPDIQAVALVGSHTRGQAKADSDIDLVLLVEDPEKYLGDEVWPAQFGKVLKRQMEDYGLVKSIRVRYDDGREVEYGITIPHWAARPLDEGTRRVIRDGMRILYERRPLLSPLEKEHPPAGRRSR